MAKRKKAKKISVAAGLLLDAIGFIVAGLILAFIPNLRLPIPAGVTVPQIVALLASMGLAFFAAHSLGHFSTALALGVRTKYFFIAPSDFRNLNIKAAKKLGGLVPTIGTKFDGKYLNASTAKRRAIVMGSGVIVSSIVMLVPLLYAFAARFVPLALGLGTAFYLANLATEVAFSTKVGDLYKMKRELNAARK